MSIPHDVSNVSFRMLPVDEFVVGVELVRDERGFLKIKATIDAGMEDRPTQCIEVMELSLVADDRAQTRDGSNTALVEYMRSESLPSQEKTQTFELGGGWTCAVTKSLRTAQVIVSNGFGVFAALRFEICPQTDGAPDMFAYSSVGQWYVVI